MDSSIYLVRITSAAALVVLYEKLVVEGKVYFCKRRELERKGFTPSKKMTVFEAGDVVNNQPRMFVDIYSPSGEFFDTQTFTPQVDGTFSLVIDTNGYPKESGTYSFGAFYGEGEDGPKLMRNGHEFHVITEEEVEMVKEEVEKVPSTWLFKN